MDKNLFLNSKKKINLNYSQVFSSSPKGLQNINIPKITPDTKFVIGFEKKNKSNNRKKLVNGLLSDGKSKDYLAVYKSKNNNISRFPIKLDEENMNSFVVDNNEDVVKQYSSIETPGYTESNYEKHKNNTKLLIRNYSMNNYINKTFHSNIDNSIVTNNNNLLLIDNNKSTHADRLDPKNAIKINKIKDDYIDFLQKQYEDNNKINFSLDSNNKELLKKCDDLIQDNILLNKALNERTNKLNKTIQENMFIKSQLDKTMLSNKKNEQRIGYYEEQLNLFKNNNDNYQKIIQELKDQNSQLNTNLTKIKTTHEDEQKKLEEKYKKRIEDIKKNMEELYNEKMQNNDKKEVKIKELLTEIKSLKDKNNELLKELQNKENIIELMYKDNEKLTNQNKLKHIEIEQNSKQIEDLNLLIQHKENLINSLQNIEIENEKIFLNKSNSRSSIKLENSDFISDNITKLINDNEENKVKIEYLNDKIKKIKKIEKKYTELIDRKTQPSSNKTSFIIPHAVISPKNSSTSHSIYVSKNAKAGSNKTYSKKIELQDMKLNYSKHNLNLSMNKYDNGIFYQKKIPMTNNSTLNVDNNNLRSNSSKVNELQTRIISEYKGTNDNKSKIINNNNNNNNNNNKSIKVSKNNRIFEIDLKKAYKDKKDKSSGKLKKIDIQNVIFNGRNSYNTKNENKTSLVVNKHYDENPEKKTIHGKELEEEPDEVKESIRKMNRKKNFTFNPNVHYNKSYEENKNIEVQIFNDQDENTEKTNNKQNSISYYLYGIDRNDFLHIFDINNKKWMDKKKIFDIDLDDKSDTFKKDYQYEGTLIYNMLEGVYILTGEKTDTLYYYNSKTNLISKVCKFKNSHDNGSIMYDQNSKCLYVFGGKNITSCEYYSLSDKKIYKLPNLNTDRANASFIVSNNKIFGFFGFSYKKDTYVRTIEYIDYYKKDKWVELKNIKILKDNILFDIESVSTMYYKQDRNKILIYSGIQGEEEEFVTNYYLIYDTKYNTMDKINKWNVNQYKHFGKIWKDYVLKKNDPKGFHFAKNSRFLLLPKKIISEGYNENDTIDILIDYKNNVHYILQDKEKIDIYRGNL